MSFLRAATQSDIFDSFRQASTRARRCDSLQEAAQATAETIFDRFAESMVLVRVFGVVPYGKLPRSDRSFADALAASKGISREVGADTQVLSLLGTCGVDPAWSDRAQSKGHLAIPLASVSFIQAVPMLARMLHELGVEVGLQKGNDKTIVARMLAAGLGGVFFVPDAATTVDGAGRKIIAAQEFVRAQNVKSVFGVAGNYVGGLSVAVLMFTRDELSRAQAAQFLALVNELKASTTSLVGGGHIYG